VKSITLADLGAKNALHELDSDLEWEGSDDSYGSAQFELPQFEGDDDSRVVSVKRPQPPSPRVNAWHFGSKELDLDAATTRIRDESLSRIDSSSPTLTRVS
jgi:hypothetical protein